MRSKIVDGNHLYIKLKLELAERICKDKEARKINSDKIIMICKLQLIKDIVSLNLLQLSICSRGWGAAYDNY